MKKVLLAICFCVPFHCGIIHAQNVGIGTPNPQKLLSVKGSILLDQGNQNAGSLDSASLLFGTATGVGISSTRSPGGTNYNGLDFWTNGYRRLRITSGGFVGINLTNNSNPGYALDVNGSINASSNLYSGFDISAGDDLYAQDDAFIGGDLRADGYAGIGTAPSSSYKLNVNGNVLVQTNLGVDGTSRLSGKVTSEGKAIMLSNNSTTLRSGFNNGIFTLVLPAGLSADVTFIITPFEGDNDNVRVMVSQFTPGSGASNWGSVVMTPHSPMPHDPAHNNQSTCKIRFQNTSSSTANLGTNAKLYLMSVVTH